MLVRHDGTGWRVAPITRRSTPFRLAGGGTKRIPISRPQLVAAADGERIRAWLLFRDVERGSRVSAGICDDLEAGAWRFGDLTAESVGMWEPSYDPVRWRRDRTLDVFVQRVGQGDGERSEDLAPQPVSILEWRPF
jgi:hypothetical protein